MGTSVRARVQPSLPKGLDDLAELAMSLGDAGRQAVAELKLCAVGLGMLSTLATTEALG